jgi:hypothetical protein
MKSLFNAEYKRDIIERIKTLTASAQPLWGSMKVSQMFIHCTVSIKISLGEIKPELKEEYLKIGRTVKDRVLETDLFTKNLPTSKEFLVIDDGNFEVNRDILIDYINRFAETDPENELKATHPYLGDLTVKEWGVLIWKHTNHHLNQFGV